MMAIGKALDINFEMAEIGEIGETVEIGTLISPFRWCKKPPNSHEFYEFSINLVRIWVISANSQN